MKESEKTSQNGLSTTKKAAEEKTAGTKSLISGEQPKRENVSETSSTAKSVSSKGSGIKKTTTTRRGTSKSTSKVTAKKVATEKAQGVEPSPKKTTAKRSARKTPASAKKKLPTAADAIQDLNSDQVPLHPIRIWPD
ncbi:MAG: hypothetical protein QNJ78_11835 [Gammaproteobacteria bacterium]|nr:hypothetical protein [Gammaproteobacteria bacterium]